MLVSSTARRSTVGKKDVDEVCLISDVLVVFVLITEKMDLI